MSKKLSEILWDAWCIGSIIGIWPRYIEPHILKMTHISLPIEHLPNPLENLKIVQLSDLHWQKAFSSILKKKIINKINQIHPDFIFFTGDFLSKSKLEEPQELIDFLNALKAKKGSFAVLGNHDYNDFITVNEEGDYDLENKPQLSNISKGFKRLFFPLKVTGRVTHRASLVSNHLQLIELLRKTPFKLLDNQTEIVPVNGSSINLCGLGEWSAGKCEPEKAFRNYHKNFPGIILSHNPDAIEKLKDYPGDLVLSGHTHGGQINLPFLWQKFTLLENIQYKRGLKKLKNKWLYINRGLSSVLKFRWFSTPELTFIVLKKAEEI